LDRGANHIIRYLEHIAECLMLACARCKGNACEDIPIEQHKRCQGKWMWYCKAPTRIQCIVESPYGVLKNVLSFYLASIRVAEGLQELMPARAMISLA